MRTIAVVTGSRAEFGLLRPVMAGVRDHPALTLAVVASGSHLVLPATTFHEVKAAFPGHIADTVPMQVAGHSTRLDDAEAVGRGVARFARCFERVAPAWVVVLGDRIEAFAAASAACIGGFALAHVHGGDRAEGIADESMRHAISKMAHAHFPATPASAERLVRMGEDPARVVVAGSPAIDDLAGIPAMDPDEFESLGAPSVVVLMHPLGRSDEQEEAEAMAVLESLEGERVLALAPNLDAGHAGVRRAIEAWAPVAHDASMRAGRRTAGHMPRPAFVGLLKTLAARGGVLVGNSSAALIEAAALRLPAVDVGTRQQGRERCGNVVHAPAAGVAAGLRAARTIDRSAITHPYGDGRAGVVIAGWLAVNDPAVPGFLRKRCVY